MDEWTDLDQAYEIFGEHPDDLLTPWELSGDDCATVRTSLKAAHSTLSGGIA